MLCPIVGGNWNNSSNTGVWALNCNNNRSNSNDNYGCRVDSKPQTVQAESGIQGGSFLRLWKHFAKSTGYPLSSRHRMMFGRLGVFL